MAVRELVRAAYAPWVAVIGREPRPMTVDYERAILDHVIDLHEHDGRMVALIEMVPETDCLLIENLAVSPAWQGRGLGDALLQHGTAFARSLQLSAVRLYTNAAFASNLRFYARRGFVEDRREHLAAGGTLVHLRKRLVG